MGEHICDFLLNSSHLTKTQKGEKNYTQENKVPAVLILEMFSAKDSLITVSFKPCPTRVEGPTGELKNRETTAAGSLGRSFS